MSKQASILLILAVFLCSFGALIWFYFSFNSFTPKVPEQIIVTEEVYDPFGTKTADNIVASSTIAEPGENTPTDFTVANKLRKISSEPVSGFSVTPNSKTGKIDLHYILRANGNIYETYADSLETKRLSITTVPKVYESAWLPGGEKLIIRYLKDGTENIESFSVKINPATTTLNEFQGGIDGNHLTENILGLALNPKGDKLFYFTSGVSGSTGFISKPDGLNKKLLFESPIVEWLVSWPKEETITLNTKPSATVPGYLYFLNSQTGNTTRILGDINGLTAKTNKTATDVLYSDSTRGTPKLYLYNIKKGESKLLPWSTFPEKCLWSNLDAKIVYCAVPKSFPKGDYPDVWYQGLTSFTDDLWLVNTDTGASTLISDIKAETGNNLDIVDLQIDPTDSYLFFSNKIDLTFWSLSLK